jgi:ribosomal protein L11 methyltransferase
VKVGAGLTIVPEWDTETKGATLLRLRPDMAFGTGHHASTWLLLEMLTGLDCRDATVLDLGAGSGILSIAATLLGAKSTLSIEHDESCRENFINNLTLNHVADSVSWRQSDVREWEDFNHDIVLANIHSAVIFPLLERYGGSGSGGTLLVSGLLKAEESEFLEICAQHGLAIENLQREGEWFAAQVRTHAGDK